MNRTKYHKALERIIAYKAYLTTPDINTIYDLSEILDIPLTCVRSDMSRIRESAYLTLDFSPDSIPYMKKEHINQLMKDLTDSGRKSDSADDVSEMLEDFLLSSDETVTEYINHGFFDHIPITLSLDQNMYDPDENDNIFVIVDYDEYLAYNNLFEQRYYPKLPAKERSFVSSSIRNKKHLCDLNYNILEHLDAIEQAIEARKCVKFKYHSFGSDMTDIWIKPVKIGFDATESRYVIIAAHGKNVKTYEFDHIVGSITVAADNGEVFNPNILSIADKVWGFEYDKCLADTGDILPPIHVSVCFYDEANVINKVKRELSFRKPKTLELTPEGNLIYEDDIYGKDSFLDWIFSYGSSVKVLEPESLVSEIKDILNRY